MLERNKNGQTHTWVEERLSLYLDNQLPPLEYAQLERHLRECARCQHSLDSLRWTIKLVKQAPAPALPRSFVLPVPKQGARPPIISFSLLHLATAVATLLLVALVGIDVITQFGGAAVPTSLSSARDAAQPTLSIAMPFSLTAPPTEAANSLVLPESSRATSEAQKVSPPVAPPAAGAAATAAPKPTSAPAATSAPTSAPRPTSLPPATAAPAMAGNTPTQTSTSMPSSVRPQASVQGATPGAPPSLGRGGGPGKATDETAEASPSPLQPQPKAQVQVAEPTATATPTSVPPTATRSVTPDPTRTPTSTPRTEAYRADPTRPAVTQPAADSSSPMITPLRLAELGALFLAVFLGALSLLLRR